MLVYSEVMDHPVRFRIIIPTRRERQLISIAFVFMENQCLDVRYDREHQLLPRSLIRPTYSPRDREREKESKDLILHVEVYLYIHFRLHQKLTFHSFQNSSFIYVKYPHIIYICTEKLS